MHISYKSGNVDAVNYCIQTLKLDPAIKTTKNQTALMLAALSNNENFFHQLIDTATNSIESSDIEGKTLLFYVFEAGNVNQIRSVLAKKPNINHQRHYATFGKLDM